MTHTPGPWKFENGSLFLKPNVSVSLPWMLPDDARLIAAAPALLEALEDALEAIEDFIPPDGDTDIQKKIRAAIALAKGDEK